MCAGRVDPDSIPEAIISMRNAIQLDHPRPDHPWPVLGFVLRCPLFGSLIALLVAEICLFVFVRLAPYSADPEQRRVSLQ